jgi:hypothetical protein
MLRDGKISRGDRGKLNPPEKRALAQQATNRRDAGMSPGDVEARNRRGLAVDAAAKKPRVFVTGGVIR